MMKAAIALLAFLTVVKSEPCTSDSYECQMKDEAAALLVLKSSHKDGFCDGGVASGDVCCAKECGKCGGGTCGKAPGGSKSCCTSSIKASGKKCKEPSDTKCVRDVAEDEIEDVGATTGGTGGSTCPTTHPYAYRPGGPFDYCCASDQDYFGVVGATASKDRSARASSCKGHNFVKCASKPCADAATAVLVDSCPSTHPFAYRPKGNFDYCCASDQDYYGVAGANNKKDMSARSWSCKGHNFKKCASPPCVDHVATSLLQMQEGTWEVYIRGIKKNGRIDKAEIYGQGGDTAWTKKELGLIGREFMNIHFGFNDASSMNGSLSVAGQMYSVIRADDQAIYAESGSEGIVATKTKHTMIIAHYSDGSSEAAIRDVEEISDFIRESGY